jgi:pimeloyl-ACP methyl ester carboxylesterase
LSSLSFQLKVPGMLGSLGYPRATSQIISIDVATGKRTEQTSGPGLKLMPQLLPDGTIGYADDLEAVIEARDLNEVTMVGHSTGGGEVARYIVRHGTRRVAAALMPLCRCAAVPLCRCAAVPLCRRSW